MKIVLMVIAAMLLLVAPAQASDQWPEPKYTTCGKTVKYPAGTSAAEIAKHEAVRCAATFARQTDPDPFVRMFVQRHHNNAHTAGGDSGAGGSADGGSAGGGADGGGGNGC